MGTTDYHAKYIAHELTRRFPPDSPEKLAGTVASAQVDLNPHQVDAALFAFKSPLSKGALLADEVGLGKTIEAGLVLSQKWAEHKRRILVITPSNLRKQWLQELTEKFFLRCCILESKSYNSAIKHGNSQPFESPDIVICSYQFAKTKATDVHATPWDLVVIDEAHRLRNVYKPSNVIANTLKEALAGKDKLLLTATPLQNSLLELYGLVSFIDEHTFGDVRSFREQFGHPGTDQEFATLKARLKPICHRTLRRQVTAYAVLHDSDRPMVINKKTNTTRKNAAWAVNENINHITEGRRKLDQVRLLASVPNFEEAFFGEEVSTDKPFSALAHLKKDDKAYGLIKQVLDALLDPAKPVPAGAVEWSALSDLETSVTTFDQAEWGHDDYSLQVENLPQAEPDPHPNPSPGGRGAQSELFDDGNAP